MSPHILLKSDASLLVPLCHFCGVLIFIVPNNAHDIVEPVASGGVMEPHEQRDVSLDPGLLWSTFKCEMKIQSPKRDLILQKKEECQSSNRKQDV